jgi:hypothetical protein
MLQVGFEPMIPVFERAKTLHALDCGVSVIGFPMQNTRVQIVVFLIM